MKNGTIVAYVALLLTVSAIIGEVWENGIFGFHFTNTELVLFGLVVYVFGMLMTHIEEEQR